MESTPGGFESLLDLTLVAIWKSPTRQLLFLQAGMRVPSAGIARETGLTGLNRFAKLTISHRYTALRRGQRLSKTDYAILGMLTIEPMSGYDMKQFCEQSLSHFWHESYGNLYPRLKRLARAGLIRMQKESRGVGPDSKVYRITRKGRMQFRKWLAEPPEDERIRSEFVLKWFFGGTNRHELNWRRLEQYERQQKQLRKQYRALEQQLQAAAREQDQALYWLMTLRRGQLLTDARLKWCRQCKTVLHQMSQEISN